MALIFILLILNISCSIANGGIVSKVLNEAHRDMENDIKCHVRNTWTGYKSQYKMICFQCKDDQRSVVIYHDEEVVDSAWVTTCNHFIVAPSVTIVPKKSSLHRIEYEMTSRGCRTMSYYANKITNQPCYEPGRRQTLSYGYVNGWKRKYVSWQMGVVRNFIPRFTESCVTKQRWKSALKPVTMRCYECTSGYVAMLYHEFGQMEALHVGTCRSRDLEDSIDIIYPSRKGPSQIRVQYKMYTDKCIYKIYEWEYGLFRYTPPKKCICTAVYNIKSMSGYLNGWKIE